MQIVLWKPPENLGPNVLNNFLEAGKKGTNDENSVTRKEKVSPDYSAFKSDSPANNLLLSDKWVSANKFISDSSFTQIRCYASSVQSIGNSNATDCDKQLIAIRKISFTLKVMMLQFFYNMCWPKNWNYKQK